MKIYSRNLPTIKQLQYFLAVSEALNFRKAAAKLGISQPPLSLQIKELENKLQTTLIFRNTQQVTLTKDGERFREKALALVEEMCLITSSFQVNEAQQILIGMTKTLSFDFIPIFKNFFKKQDDNIIIYKDDYTSKQLLVELQKKNLDFAILSYYPHDDNSILSQLIHQEPMFLAIPASHPASNHDLVDFNDVLDLPLYWFNRYLNPVYYDQCESVFKHLSSPLIRRKELPDTLSMLLDISLGKGMLFIPESNTRAGVPGVVYKRFTPYFERKFLVDIFLVWQESAVTKAHAINMINYFKQ